MNHAWTLLVIYFLGATLWAQPLGVPRAPRTDNEEPDASEAGDAPAAPSPVTPLTPPGVEPEVPEEDGDTEDDAKPAEEEVEMIRPQYNGASLELLIQDIEQRTGKIVLRDPGVPDVTITLRSREPIPVKEFLNAVESLLGMNNIAMVPFRDHFIKLVPAQAVSRAGVNPELDSDVELDERDKRISRLVELRHLDFSEVQALITERLSPTANVQPLERNNAFLITDSETNILRIQKILDLVDRPAEVREEVKIYQVSNASAADVKQSLEALIEEGRGENPSSSRANTVRSNIRTPPGVIRANRSDNNNASNPVGEGTPSPGLIRGRVQIVADERTNILLVVSRPVNDPFFEEMIAALDKKVDPEVSVRIYHLQFADATEVSGTLNELIGAAGGDARRPAVEGGADGNEEGGRSGQSLRDFIRRRETERQPAPNPEGQSLETIGRLSENTRILADERTNSLIFMGRNRDLDVLEEVVEKLDIMLAQVAVRAVIMEVSLNENLSYGLDWLQRSLTVDNVETVNGVEIREPVAGFAGGQNLSSNSTGFRDGGNIGRDIQLAPGSLSYFATLYDFNLDAVLRLAQGSSDAKVLATPIIMTMDNTEASIVVGERRAIPTTTSTTLGGSVQTAINFEDIGLELTVTPRINPQGVVIMEVSQSSDNVGGNQIIDGNEVPIITTRQLDASVAIRSGGTLALGGLVREDERESVTKVPILGSIPFLGALFRSKSTDTSRTELLVLLSPEVLVSAEEAEHLTRQLKGATELENAKTFRGWNPPELDETPDAEEAEDE